MTVVEISKSFNQNSVIINAEHENFLNSLDDYPKNQFKDNEIQTEFNMHQLDLERMNQQIEIDSLRKQFKDLEDKVVIVNEDNELDELTMNIEKQMVKFQAQVDKFQSAIKFDPEISPNEGGDCINIEFQSNMKNKSGSKFPMNNHMFDIGDIQNITQLPMRRNDVSELMERYDNEYKFIQDLNLKKIILDTFTTLEKSLQTIHRHSVNYKIGEQDPDSNEEFKAIQQLNFQYNIISDMAQQKEYLESFNQKFSRIINQIVTVMQYLKQKEHIHMSQLESLAQQNSVLFEENCQLQKQLQLKASESINNMVGLSQYNSEKHIQAHSKKLIKELNSLYHQKLELLKSQISQESSLYSATGNMLNDQLPKLQFLPLEDPKIYQKIQVNIDLIQEIARVCKSKIDTAANNEQKYKSKITDIMNNYKVFREVLDNLVKKQLPRCKRLLEIDQEYIKITMFDQRNLIDQCITKVYNDDKNKKREESKLSNKISALNILVCHEQVIEKIENLILQIQ
ncbi:UNKNOWN [Stylonychia lemnae]|uniref:Uncharacterized protein n=1 Tax=Stylonychia lemnae TaxID=5949 RepID=A0A078B6N1_STYLE|nr:UNKNOWN [Stylonychia lemnae]|eukprot:CDW88942.1 UNKNOWN [Stylonychia lemnae]